MRRFFIPSPRVTRIAAVVLVFAALLVAGAKPLGRAVEAALVMDDLAAGPGPSLFKNITSAPSRDGISYRIGARNHEADLYRPGEDPNAVLVLVPGALATGKDDPRLVAFAATLARAGFGVLAPDIPSVRALQLRASDSQDVADAVDYLADSDETSARPLGIVALSYAAGPAILALLDPAVGDKVDFVVAIGGYHDADAVLTFFTTGYYRDPPGGPWRHRRPNAYGKWLFVAGNVGLIADASDRDVLAQMAGRKLEDLSADVSDLAQRLGAEGRAVVDFVMNVDPGRARDLIGNLPAAVRAEIEALDLKRRDLTRLHPGLILIHGRDDAIVPESESMALAAAAAPGRADLYLVERLAHVDLGPVGLRDALTLWRAIYRLLEERDRSG
ncbi:MAG TPA: alpha/beta hydrolase [Alphaproteobacteria bacterium]|nr:alpha/beta hydrolase [Alphaproteobacteria bacterium]